VKRLSSGKGCDLVTLATELSSVGGDTRKSDDLINRTRYPNAHDKPDIPATVFTQAHARIAAAKAEQIVQLADSMIN
jgi:hypothetical protein